MKKDLKATIEKTFPPGAWTQELWEKEWNGGNEQVCFQLSKDDQVVRGVAVYVATVLSVVAQLAISDK